MIISVWVAACVFCLLDWIYSSNPHDPEIVMVFNIEMLILTFPSGFVYFFLFAFSGEWIGWQIINWIIVTVIGFFQWYFLVPKILRALKR